MKLPISVVMTSSVPELSRSNPGHSAHNAPPARPARKDSGTSTRAGAPFIRVAAPVAQIAPT